MTVRIITIFSRIRRIPIANMKLISCLFRHQLNLIGSLSDKIHIANEVDFTKCWIYIKTRHNHFKDVHEY